MVPVPTRLRNSKWYETMSGQFHARGLTHKLLRYWRQENRYRPTTVLDNTLLSTNVTRSTNFSPDKQLTGPHFQTLQAPKLPMTPYHKSLSRYTNQERFDRSLGIR